MSVRLAPLVALALLVGACGTTIRTPPKLATPASGEKDIPYDANYARHHCRHYYYIYDEAGVRHRTRCPRPSPTPPPDPNPTPTPTPPVPPYHPASGCGVERWAVKTATDPGANGINLTPTGATIAALVAFAPPVNPTDRIAPVETTTWRVHATIVFAKHEQDGDYHLGLSDGQGSTMIAESPDPSCAQGSVLGSQIGQVRQVLDQACPQLAQGRTVRPSIQATLEGIGFFDRLHGQTDVAPDGLELHPLVAVTLGSRC